MLPSLGLVGEKGGGILRAVASNTEPGSRKFLSVDEEIIRDRSLPPEPTKNSCAIRLFLLPQAAVLTFAIIYI